MAYFKKIAGERCYLSPIDPDDAPLTAAWINDPEVAAGVTLARNIINAAQERDTLVSLAARPHHFAIVAQDGDALLGICGIEDVSAIDRTGELGIMIGDKRFWDRGFGAEAVRLLLRFAFLTLNLNNIRLTVHSFNERAIRCYRKCGFKRCGYWPDSWYHDGALHGTVTMYLLRADFREAPPSPAPPGSTGEVNDGD